MSASFLPIWILNADVIRRMVGDERPLLSALIKTDGKLDTSVVPVEPGLQSESLWWIPDLVSPDHFWLFPMTFGALSIANAWLAFGKNLPELQRKHDALPLDSKARISSGVIKTMVEFATYAPALITWIIIKSDTPTAVVLYIMSSAAMMLVQRPLVDLLTGRVPKAELLEAKLPKLKGRFD